MELYKVIKTLMRLPNQNVDIGHIMVSEKDNVLVMLTDGKTYIITDDKIRLHDPNYKPNYGRR